MAEMGRIPSFTLVFSINKCLVISILSIHLGPKESGVLNLFPKPMIRPSAFGSIFNLCNNFFISLVRHFSISSLSS